MGRYVGPGVLVDGRDAVNGEPMPAPSDDLIIAMHNGRPMAPKLMWEPPRAAMNLGLKRGRVAVNRFLDQLYGRRRWIRAALATCCRRLYAIAAWCKLVRAAMASL
jgi:hypothetical protein